MQHGIQRNYFYFMIKRHFQKRKFAHSLHQMNSSSLLRTMLAFLIKETWKTPRLAAILDFNELERLNLVPRVLWLFGQRMGASRDSGVLEFCYRKTGGSDELVSSADSRCLAIVTSRQSERSHANDFRKWRTCRCLCHHFKLIFLC